MAGIYIVSDLGGSSDISVYAMVFFGLGNLLSMPLANSIADRIGQVKLLVYALLLYAFFSILCSNAATFAIFNFYRLGLGFASGIFFILCRRILQVLAKKEKLEYYGFIMLLLYAITPVLGVCFGAFLAYEGHWRWIFHFNEPVALALSLYFWVFYRKTDEVSNPPLPFDKVGYFFFLVGIFSLTTALTLSQELDWYRSNLFLSLIFIGVPSFVFFILWQFYHPHPLLELRLFKNFILSYALINLAILFSCYFGMIILITLWLNIYANYTPIWISALVGTMAIAGLLAYFFGRKLLQKFDPRWTLAFAIFSFAISCYYSTYFNVDTDFYHLMVARFLAGLGLVFFLIPIFHMAIHSHGPEKSSHVFTIFQIVRALSSSLGAGLYVILWQRRQAFFHERLTEGLFSPLTKQYFENATKRFYLTKQEATAELGNLIDTQATSLGLNDVFGFMGYLLLGLLLLLLLSFVFVKSQTADEH